MRGRTDVGSRFARRPVAFLAGFFAVLVAGGWWLLDLASKEPAASAAVPSERTAEDAPRIVEPDGASARHPEALQDATTVTAPAPSPSFEIRFVDAETLAALAESSWKLRSSDGTVLEREADREGRCRVPRGEWTITAASSGPSRFPVPDRLDGRSILSATVWVHAPSTMQLLVADEFGVPVESARVVWTPGNLFWDPLGPEPRGWSPKVPRAEVRTDARGRASIGLAHSNVGTLGVRHPDFEVFLAEFARPPTSLDVRLHAASSAARTITFLASGDLRPVPGVQVHSLVGGTVAQSDALGLARIPGSAMGEEELRLSGGCYPLVVAGRDLNADELLLPRRSRVVLEPVPALRTGESALALPEWGDDPWSGVGRLDLPLHIDVERDGTGIELPRGIPVRVSVATDQGRSGTVELVPSLEEERIALRLSEASALDVAAVDPDGVPVDSFRVRCRFDEGSLVIDGGAKRHAHLPGAEQIQRFSVHAEGYASAYLRPTRRASPSSPASDPSGLVTVELLPSHDIEVRVTDPTGQPLDGYLVNVTSRRIFESAQRYPELFGCWPTDHPAWVGAIEPTRSGQTARTTDPGGRVVLTGLAAGVYELGAEVHPRRVAGGAVIAPPPASTTVSVPTSRAVEIVAERVRPVLLHVNESVTGSPVPKFFVTANAQGLARPSKGHGGVWQGWVQQGLDLMISAPGLAGSVPARRLERSDAVEVTLDPDSPTALLLEGEVDGLAGRKLHVLVRLSAKPEAVAWRLMVPVEDPRNALPFYVPFEDEIVLTIDDVQSVEARWQFTPKDVGGATTTWRFDVRKSRID